MRVNIRSVSRVGRLEGAGAAADGEAASTVVCFSHPPGSVLTHVLIFTRFSELAPFGTKGERGDAFLLEYSPR